MMITLLMVSCSNETQDAEPTYSNGASPLTVYASISGNASMRATQMEKDDKWSYTGFEDKDEMGFYSPQGNWMEDEGKGAFTNQRLIYKDSKFTDPDGVEFSPTHMSGSQIFMYFPYSALIDKENGMELRKEEKDSLRCIDFLSSNEINLQGVSDNGNKVALYGTFDHAFSELIIMRGEGFDNPPKGKERITAVLHEPYTNIKINVTDTDESWSCTPELVYDKDVISNFKIGLTEEELKKEAQRWDAWHGGNYGITSQDPVGKLAWYIIVPTLGSEIGKKKAGARSYVDYIELFDNEGNLYQVSSLKLSGGNSKYVDAGWRYPMEITMKELVPTVNPFRIIPWNDDVNLTDERTRGINNESEFANWVRDYNAYLLFPQEQDKIDALLKYGDTFVDAQGNNRSWHFYVLSDLNLSNYESSTPEDELETPQNNKVIIPQLHDILDGISTTLVNSKFINHTITGLSKTLIDKLEYNGSIQNFDFINPEVSNDEESTVPAGIIANTMNGSNTSVVNCNIDNGTLFNPGGPAGMVVGSITDGLVKDCMLSGFLSAESTATGNAAKIAGKTFGNPTFTNNDADAVPNKIN